MGVEVRAPWNPVQRDHPEWGDGMSGWRVEWNGTALTGDECPGDACLIDPPDGLGITDIRDEDVTYMMRDGIRMHRDWYSNRVLTFQAVVSARRGECGSDCDSPTAVRRRVQEILSAWSRQCEEGELVLWAPCDSRAWCPDDISGCDDSGDSGIAMGDPAYGPYGIRGRPRAATVQYGGHCNQYAYLTLRFDAVDHRLYVLNECGIPGSGESCTELLPTSRDNQVICWDENGELCDDSGEYCFVDPPDVDPDEGPQPVVNSGSECACPIITLNGPLQEPSLITDDGQRIDVFANLDAGDMMVINCCEDQITFNGTPANYLVEGCISLETGTTMIQLFAFTGGGSASICHRDSVVSA